MKKYLRTVIVIGVLAIAAVGYYFYLANKDITQQAVDQAAASDEASALINRDIEKTYPESPKEVAALYARISKCYYDKDTKEELIDGLAKQARILFDDELNQKHPYNEFLAGLKEEVSQFKESNIYISGYTVQTASGTRYGTFEGRQYATIHVLYYFREGSTLRSSYYKYTMRKNDAGQWKILFWELDTTEEE